MTRQEVIDGLREAADFIETHPDLAIYQSDMFAPKIDLTVPVDTAGDLARTARALGSAVKGADDDYMRVTEVVGPVELGAFASRSQVCERKVVGTETVEREKVAKPAIMEVVTETVDVVEWECEPLLSVVPDA